MIPDWGTKILQAMWCGKKKKKKNKTQEEDRIIKYTRFAKDNPQNRRKYLQSKQLAKDLSPKIYKQLMQLNIKKAYHPIKKMGRRPK